MTLSPIATRSAYLLAVAFQRSRQGIVHDVADVGLVDTHTKRDGGNDDELIRFHKLVLYHRLIVRLHAGMKWPGFQTGLVEFLGNFVGIPLCSDIDYRGTGVSLEEGSKVWI